MYSYAHGKVALIYTVIVLISYAWFSAAQQSNSSPFNASLYEITFNPPKVLKVIQKSTANLTITIAPKVDQFGSAQVPPAMVTLRTVPLYTHGSVTEGIDVTTINVTSTATTTTTITVTGKLVGKDTIEFTFTRLTDASSLNDSFSLEAYNISGLKLKTVEQEVGLLIGVACISLTMASFAGRLDKKAVKAFFAGPKVGLLSVLVSYFVMPPLSVGVGLLWDLPYYMIFSMLAIGCCPPGGPANSISLLLGGNLETSIIITTLGTLLSVAFCPVWMVLLGQVIANWQYEPNITIRYPIILLDVFILIFFVPSIVAFALSYKWPRFGRKFALFIRPFSLLGTLGALVLIIVSNVEWFLPLVTKWTYVVCPASLSLIGYLIGFLMALVFGRMSAVEAVTFGAQAGIANISFAILMTASMLPAPDGDMAYVPGFFFVFSSLGLAIILLPAVIAGRWLRDRYWPGEFKLSSTDKRLEEEQRKVQRKEKEIRRNVSLISDMSSFESTDFMKIRRIGTFAQFTTDQGGFESNASPSQSDLITDRNETEFATTQQVEEDRTSTGVSFEIGKW